MPNATIKILDNYDLTVHSGNELHQVLSGTRTTDVKKLEKGTFDGGRDETVKKGQTTEITGGEVRIIESGDQTVSVKGDQNIEVASGSRKLTVGAKGTNNYNSSYFLNVTGVSSLNYTGSFTENFKGSLIHTNQVDQDLTYNSGLNESINGFGSYYFRNSGLTHTISSSNWLTKAAKASIKSTGSGTLNSSEFKLDFGGGFINIYTTVFTVNVPIKESQFLTFNSTFKSDAFIFGAATRIFDSKVGAYLRATNLVFKLDAGILKMDFYGNKDEKFVLADIECPPNIKGRVAAIKSKITKGASNDT